jgi:chromosome segregation ATPase
MNRVSKPLIVLLVAAVGVWGCSQTNPGQSAAQAEQIKALQAKCNKLEDDYKSAAAARDQARKRVATLEEERAQVDEQVAQLQKGIEAGKLVAKERDDLRQQMESRTGERDQLQARCDKLKKGLQTLLGQDDALSAPVRPAAPATGAGGL